jgi:hypothetical protein
VELYRCALFLMLCSLAVVGSGAALIGPERAAVWLFGEGFSGTDFLWVLASVPLAVAASGFAETVFFVRDRFDRYVVASSAVALSQPLLFIGLTWLLGVKGIFVAFAASSVILATVFYGDLARLQLFDRRWLSPRWNTELALYLAKHGLTLFAIGVGGGALLLCIRSNMLQTMGAASIGILQVPLALSAYGGAFVTNFLWGRIHPRFATLEGRNPFELSFAICASFLITLGTWFASPLLIRLIYTHEFDVAIPFVGLQSAGDVLYFSFSTIGVALLAIGHMRLFLLGWILYYAPFAAFLLFPQFHGVKNFLFVHILASGLATLGLLIAAFRSDRAWRRACMRLGLLICTLFSIMLTIGLSGNFAFLGRMLVTAAATALSLLCWSLLYGKAARMQMLEILSWMNPGTWKKRALKR